MILAELTRNGTNAAQVQDVVNIILAVAIVVLVLLAVAKLCGAAIAPRATWVHLLIAAAILLVVWLIW